MILLDPRMGSGLLRSYIPAGHRVELCTLDSGDVRWNGNGPTGRVSVGIEIKHLGDFLQSMEDGRLAGRQLREMRREYDYVFILLQDRIAMGYSGHLQVWLPKQPKRMQRAEWERKRYCAPHYNNGRFVDAIFGARSKFLWSAFWNRITSLSIGGGFRLLMAGSNQEVGTLLGGAYDWWQRRWSEHTSVNVFDESHLPTLIESSVPARAIHAAVHGIGWEKSMRAAEHFGTLEAMCEASTEEWQAVPGIGPVIALRAVRAFRQKHVFRTISGRPGEVQRRKVVEQ